MQPAISIASRAISMEKGEKNSRPKTLSAPKVFMAAACFGLVAILGYIDYVTGYEQSFLLFYLLPIGMATWWGSFAFGVVFSILSVAAWIISDVAAGVPAVGFWNAGMALASYFVYAFLLAKLRTLFRELDQRVRDRTKALSREIAERERLDRELVEVGDRERRRLGQELHDGLCQHLTGTALTAQTLREKLAARSADEVEEADKVVRYIEEGIDLSRDLARGLFSPELEPEGLMVALQALAENMTERFPVACTFQSNGDVRVLDSSVATQLYRIAQEALVNAIKHADARRVDMSLVENDTTVTLKIEDDGVGIPQQLPQRGGLGVRLMSHGAALVGADFQIGRNAGGGTTVVCKINVPNEQIEL
jgi:signal transduction histidine kinase